MRFDAVIVPRGAEAQAVVGGWPAARPKLSTVAAGSAAGETVAGMSGTTALVLGLCGAVDPKLRVGDVVVYARIRNGPDVITLDPRLAADCVAGLDSVLVDAAAVTAVVGAVAAKRALWVETGVAVVDMEAAPLARALHGRGVRVAMVRVVSDDAGAELPDLARVFDGAGRLRPLPLALTFARTPLRSARFIAGAIAALRALHAVARRLALSAE